jgi:uncharacterized protein YjbJ (UPF0337 family)
LAIRKWNSKVCFAFSETGSEISKGKGQKLGGEAVVDAAKAQQRATGVGEEAKGNIKELGGKVMNDDKLKAEGQWDQTKGQIRQELNK